MTFAMEFTKALEKALNLYLDADPEIASELDQVAGKHVGFALSGIDLKFVLELEAGGRIRVTPAQAEDLPETYVRGTPLALLRMVFSEQAGMDHDLIIEGDAEVAQRLWSVLRDIELDWEDWLAGPLGDGMSHAVAKRLRAFGAWNRRTFKHLIGDLDEYLTEEIKLAPPAAEVEDFMSNVDILREDIDRLEARIAR
ncbi:ubiquinone biosynthesis accessory factor UbiJ, partial [Acidihalobacter prosperus]